MPNYDRMLCFLDERETRPGEESEEGGIDEDEDEVHIIFICSSASYSKRILTRNIIIQGFRDTSKAKKDGICSWRTCAGEFSRQVVTLKENHIIRTRNPDSNCKT
jgi:hypothetical protein